MELITDQWTFLMAQGHDHLLTVAGENLQTVTNSTAAKGVITSHHSRSPIKDDIPGATMITARKLHSSAPEMLIYYLHPQAYSKNRCSRINNIAITRIVRGEPRTGRNYSKGIPSGVHDSGPCTVELINAGIGNGACQQVFQIAGKAVVVVDKKYFHQRLILGMQAGSYSSFQPRARAEIALESPNMYTAIIDIKHTIKHKPMRTVPNSDSLARTRSLFHGMHFKKSLRDNPLSGHGCA